MYINPLLREFDSSSSTSSAASSSGTNNTGTTTGSNSLIGLNGNSFITLLTAELQAQDPTEPMDPTTMLTQLVQFNELQQTMEINQTLQTALGSSASTATPSLQQTQLIGGI